MHQIKELRPLVIKLQANPFATNVEATMGIGHAELDRMCVTYVGSPDIMPSSVNIRKKKLLTLCHKTKAVSLLFLNKRLVNLVVLSKVH